MDVSLLKLESSKLLLGHPRFFLLRLRSVYFFFLIKYFEIFVRKRKKVEAQLLKRFQQRRIPHKNVFLLPMLPRTRIFFCFITKIFLLKNPFLQDNCNLVVYYRKITHILAFHSFSSIIFMHKDITILKQQDLGYLLILFCFPIL